MHLREEEEILKIFHHHSTPFIYQILKAIIGVTPFYIGAFTLGPVLSTSWYVIAHLILFFLFCLIVTYLSLIYWLDKLIITNQRVIHIDYKYLTVREDSSAQLEDIQDIQTKEKGILAYIRFFDYGTFSLDTSSSYVAITFKDAPNPEEIRKFIYKAKNMVDDRKQL